MREGYPFLFQMIDKCTFHQLYRMKRLSITEEMTFHCIY